MNSEKGVIVEDAGVYSRCGHIQNNGRDIGGAKELGVIYFPTNWGAKEPPNLPSHRVVRIMAISTTCWNG